jgi:hypothetical protein
MRISGNSEDLGGELDRVALGIFRFGGFSGCFVQCRAIPSQRGNSTSDTCQTYVVWKKWRGSVERDMFVIVVAVKEENRQHPELSFRDPLYTPPLILGIHHDMSTLGTDTSES